MTAVLRVGGEWKPYAPSGSAFNNGYHQAGQAFHGQLSNNKVDVITPGRTGGAMYRCSRGTTTAPATVASTATHSTAALVPRVPDNVFVIGRCYFKVNKYPASGGLGIPIFLVKGAGGFGAFLFNDGRLGATFGDSASSGLRSDLPDAPPIPIGQWIMVEAANTWSAASKRRAVLRVTLPGQEPQIIYCRGQLDPQTITSPNDIPSFTAGMIADAGASFVIDVDDIGVNTGNGGVHDTWLGPGRVRVARPSADGPAAVVYDTGSRASTARGQQGRTIPDDPDAIDPLLGDPLVVCAATAFAEALNNNPIVPPTGGPGTRCDYQDRMITSSGSDWHRRTQYDVGMTPVGYTWDYDHPRLGAAGDILEVTCDASDRVGNLSFAMPVAIGVRWNYGTIPSSPPAADKFMSLYTGNESAPASADPSDRASINFGRFGVWDPGTDGNWRPMLGRMQQNPSLPVNATLRFRREHPCSEATPPHYEWASIGAGIVYESDYTPQDPIPECPLWSSWT